MTGYHSETHLMAKRYAIALFELCSEEKAIDKVLADVAALTQLSAESADFKRLIENPIISKTARLSAVAEIAKKASLSPITTNFLSVLANNDRLYALAAVISSFQEEVALSRGEATADVISAIQLDEEQKQALVDTLSQSFGKKIQLNCIVNPSLLGGLVVQLGSKMIDTSLRTKLNNLKLTMKEVG